MSIKKLSLKNDVVFKELFSKKGNEIFLKDFLSDLLNLNICDIHINKDASLNKDTISDKYGILDIKAILNDNTIVDIELQLTNYKNMEERTLYYSSKLISSQLEPGQEYIELKPVIIIAIIDFILFPFEDYITESITVAKKHLDYEIMKKQKFYFIELPKFRKNPLNLKTKTNQWLTFIDGENKEGVVKAMKNNKVIKQADEELEYLTGDAEMIRLAELREKALKDHNSFYNSAKREGIKEGIEKNKIFTAKAMLSKKIDLNLISEITSLTIEEINKLK